LLRCDGSESQSVAVLDGSWQDGRLHSKHINRETNDGPNLSSEKNIRRYVV
jgi:hypothetical protein